MRFFDEVKCEFCVSSPCQCQAIWRNYVRMTWRYLGHRIIRRRK